MSQWHKAAICRMQQTECPIGYISETRISGFECVMKKKGSCKNFENLQIFQKGLLPENPNS